MHIQGAHAVVQQIMHSSDKHWHTTSFDVARMHAAGMSTVGDSYKLPAMGKS